MIAHDLRSPLTVITGYTDLLLNQKAGDLSDVQTEFIGAIEDRANAMRKLVDEFLMVSKFEASFISLDVKDVDLNAIVRDVMKSLQLIAANKQITVRDALDGDLPTIRGDADKLYKVVTNLYDNALKYTPDGGTVTVSTACDAATVRLEVRDDGIGIDERELPFVFDRYKRMATAERRRIQGTGLGLAIVKEIVGAHAGRVWVESRPDRGSAFFVELPLSLRARDASTTADAV
jgi:signal transduction histidine kinase